MKNAANKETKWVRREINRLAKAAEIGGSSSFIIYQQQAVGLAQKYGEWATYRKHSIFTGAATTHESHQ